MGRPHLSSLGDTGGFLPAQDVTIVSACAPPGGGRNPVTPRFIRHFSMLCLPMPSEHSLKQIFQVSVDLSLSKGGKENLFVPKLPQSKQSLVFLGSLSTPFLSRTRWTQGHLGSGWWAFASLPPAFVVSERVLGMQKDIKIQPHL